MAAAKKTRDHDAIRKWIEERGGEPAVVDETHGSDEEAGLLRVKFQEDEEELETVCWNEFFATFGEHELTFLYQDEDDSRFNKFIRE